MRDEEKFEVIDDIKKFTEDPSLKWRDCFKSKRIKARKATPGEEVKTVLADGTEETDVRKAKEGDWIVSNAMGGGEQWIISNDVFTKRYVLDKRDADGEEVYKPKGNPMMAAKLQKSIEFKPPMWGGDVQRINAGGWLLRDKENKDDIYGIGADEFADTYSFSSNIKESKKRKFTSEQARQKLAFWKKRLDEMVVDQNIQDYDAKYFCIFKNDDLLRVFKEYKEKLSGTASSQIVGESAGDFYDTPFFKYKSTTYNGKPAIEAVYTGPSVVSNDLSPKLRAANVPEQFDTGTTLIIDPSKIKAGGDVADGVVDSGFIEGTEVDPDIPVGAETHTGNVEDGATTGAEGGSDIANSTGDSDGHWWGSGIGGGDFSWALLLKWLSIGLTATILLYKTYPWWGQKIKYMIQKCKNGKSLASMEFTTDDWGGDKGNNYRFRYDFRYGRWILEYTSMKVFSTKTFPSPQEVEQFIKTDICKKFVSRCAEVLYRVLDDEAFDGFVEVLKERDRTSYEFCKQLVDNRVNLHRTFETMKVKYL